jgi:hypothetical protein
MDPGVFFTGVVFIVIALAIVLVLRRRRPEFDPEEDQAALVHDATGWAQGFTPRPVSELPYDPLAEDPPPTGIEPTPEEYLAGYLFSAEDLRALGRDQARSRLMALHYPAGQIEEVLDTIFGRGAESS